MHSTIQNLINIKNQIESRSIELKINKVPKIIAVSKTFKMDKILPLVEHGHIDFGENKVQEAFDKWTDIKSKYPSVKLHMVGKLQTNKVKFAVKIFDYIHSVDNEKLAKKISEEQKKISRNLNIFIQVNIGNENQKSGIEKNNLDDFINYCRLQNLNIIGLMCIPPMGSDTSVYFEEMEILNKKYKFPDLSMGMSSDYLHAVQNSASFLRIGSSIFGQRS